MSSGDSLFRVVSLVCWFLSTLVESLVSEVAQQNHSHILSQMFADPFPRWIHYTHYVT
jgi:hypothetical protein